MIDFSSFSDEFRKIAEAIRPTETASMASFQRRIKPGDILLTSFTRAEPQLQGRMSLPERVFRSLSRKMQGETEHSALYIGKGKVIETAPRTGAVTKPISDMIGGAGGIVAVRPLVEDPERLKAVSRAKELLGTRYGTPRLVRAGLANFVKLNPEKINDRLKHEYICSTLVGDAYNQVQFNERKPFDALMPADFYRSDKTQTVARLHPSS